jgi:hypothetical protein
MITLGDEEFMSQKIFIAVSIVLTIALATVQILSYFSFKRKVKRPLKFYLKQFPGKTKRFHPVDSEVEKYYFAYSKLPSYELKLSKHYLNSQDTSDNYFGFLLDIIAKALLPLVSLFISAAIPYLIGFLDFTKDKPDGQNMLSLIADTVISIFNNITLILIFLIPVIVLPLIDYPINKRKNSLIKLHLSIIHEYENKLERQSA